MNSSNWIHMKAKGLEMSYLSCRIFFSLDKHLSWEFYNVCILKGKALNTVYVPRLDKMVISSN